MKKLLLSSLLAFSLYVTAAYAGSNKGEMDKCLVSGGKGSLMVEANDKSKLTITVKTEDGTFILSEEVVSSDSGKLQLLGLANGFYEVEIKTKKNSKVFRVEVQ